MLLALWRHGGNIEVYSYAGNVDFSAGATVNSSGGSGAEGGNAGRISIGAGYIYNSGGSGSVVVGDTLTATAAGSRSTAMAAM